MSLLNNFTSLSQCYKNVVKTSNLIKTLVQRRNSEIEKTL